MYVDKEDYGVLLTRWGHGSPRPPVGSLVKRMLEYIKYLETSVDTLKSELGAIKEEQNE